MPSYETAVKLKEAGFPQKILGEVPSWIVWHPTLEELIEACGDKFISLVRYLNPKLGFYADGGSIDAILREDGISPEEAVANLWLVLNKK